MRQDKRDSVKQMMAKRQAQRLREQASQELATYKSELKGTLADLQQTAETQAKILADATQVNTQLTDFLLDNVMDSKKSQLDKQEKREKIRNFREKIGVKR